MSPIARRGVESGGKLRRHLWAVEGTHAWFNRFRRLPVHYERRTDLYEAFTSLAASLVTLNQIRRFCSALFGPPAVSVLT